MGCKFSSTKQRDPPSAKSSVKGSNRPPQPADGTAQEPASNADNPPSNGHGNSPTATSPYSPTKHPFAHELTAADENALEEDSSAGLSPNRTHQQPQHAQQLPQQRSDAAAEDESGEEGGSGMDLNGSFANVDLNGSFHIHYNMKGDIIPNATLPESRRGRSVTPKLLAALSPHPSDDDMVLICTDCGMTIDESCETLCPLTGKIHV